MTTHSVVMTIPPGIADDLNRKVRDIVPTAAAFSDLFCAARHSLKIIAPYVDPTFTGLVAAVRAPVRVVTTPSPGRPPRPNPVLERCATLSDLTVRYVNERRDRALIFQMHAKLVIADAGRAYLGSACLTDTSCHYNAELGLLIDEPPVIAQLERIFDFFFDTVGVRASEL